jgi:hypothetical protein
MPITFYVKTAAALFLAGLLAWAGQTLYAAGYDSALADHLRGQQAREAQIADRFVAAVTDSEQRRRAALAELNELRSRPPVVITDVQTEIINRNVCRSFDRDFIGLLDAT